MLKKYKFSLLTLTAILWTIFGYGLAYTSFITDNIWIVMLGLALGLFWTFTLIKTLQFQAKKK